MADALDRLNWRIMQSPIGVVDWSWSTSWSIFGIERRGQVN